MTKYTDMISEALEIGGTTLTEAQLEIVDLIIRIAIADAKIEVRKEDTAGLKEADFMLEREGEAVNYN